MLRGIYGAVLHAVAPRSEQFTEGTERRAEKNRWGGEDAENKT
jgi:hypothetical protein